MKLKELLPEGYKEACWETGALQRRSGVYDEDTILLLSLFYGYGHSLIEVSSYAEINNMCKISDVAFMKKFNKCTGWFSWITENMKPEAIMNYPKPEKLNDYRVLAVDASDIISGGKQRHVFHLHYAIDLFKLSCASFKLTNEKTGETLKNFTPQKNDLFIGDRAYATITGIEHCLKNGSNFILRLRNNAFNLYNENGEKLSYTDILKQADKECKSFSVFCKGSDNKMIPIRVCAVRKTDEEIKRTQKKIHRKESKKQMQLSDETKFINEFFLVVTSLDETFSAEEILNLYRLRWQVEMLFKRYKSILNMGSMPVKNPESGMAWLSCKMLIALIIEKMISVSFFSPYAQSTAEYLAGDEDSLQLDFEKCF